VESPEAKARCDRAPDTSVEGRSSASHHRCVDVAAFALRCGGGFGHRRRHLDAHPSGGASAGRVSLRADQDRRRGGVTFGRPCPNGGCQRPDLRERSPAGSPPSQTVPFAGRVRCSSSEERRGWRGGERPNASAGGQPWSEPATPVDGPTSVGSGSMSEVSAAALTVDQALRRQWSCSSGRGGLFGGRHGPIASAKGLVPSGSDELFGARQRLAFRRRSDLESWDEGELFGAHWTVVTSVAATFQTGRGAPVRGPSISHFGGGSVQTERASSSEHAMTEPLRRGGHARGGQVPWSGRFAREASADRAGRTKRGELFGARRVRAASAGRTREGRAEVSRRWSFGITTARAVSAAKVGERRMRGRAPSTRSLRWPGWTTGRALFGAHRERRFGDGNGSGRKV